MQTNTANIPMPEDSSPGVWITTPDQARLFEKQAQNLEFKAVANQLPVIQVDVDKTLQTLHGFGFSLTGGSAYLLNRLPAATLEALLDELFSTQGQGIGVGF